ncbi:MAG: GxxExxY protein [Holophagaceae bacterium]|nr:GxxExxY protein [Holophagaceae bacterium]
MMVRILECAANVHSTFGSGYTSRVYESALFQELQRAGVPAQRQQGLDVPCDGLPVGQFVADILVDARILLQIEVSRVLEERHLAQGLNYLQATGLETCLLLNFGAPRLETRRLHSASLCTSPAFL